MSVVKKIMKHNEMGVLIPLLLLWIITYIANNAFFSAYNMIALFRTVSISLLGAIGAAFCFSCGMMDLSAGSVYGLAGMVAGIFMVDFGLPVPVAVIAGLMMGVIFGIINGVIINYLGLPAFIATLGTSYVARGVVNVISQGSAKYGFPDSFTFIGGSGPLSIPWSIYIALVLAIIAAYVLKYTIYGRQLLAVGGNPETARVCGINVVRVRNIAYIISGVMCALAGILQTARLATAQSTAGNGWEMTIIAATIIGGVSMYGGSTTISGTVIGVTLMETLTVSMTMLKVNAYWQKVAVGIVIILAVTIDTYRRKSMSSGKG